MEGAHEIQGLRFWRGNPTVQLLAADEGENAMLLEQCEPGHSLRSLPEHEQDPIIASLLRRCWRPPGDAFAFRPLAAQMAHWAAETSALAARWPDTGLVRQGLQLFEDLSTPGPDDVLLATDLHAGNVLRAQREPWLVIDPKPFAGDRAYDATQHLLNCRGRLRTDPLATIRRLSDLLELDEARVRWWLFARLAAEPRHVWDAGTLALARCLS